MAITMTVQTALDRLENLERSAAGHGRTEWAAKLAVMRDKVAAAAQLQAARRGEAFAAIHEAVARDDRIEAPRELPNPDKPACVLLG
jgi:hypothetical protein